VSGEWQGLAKDFEKDFDNVVQLSATARGQGFRNLLGSFCQILEVRHPSRADGQPATKIQVRAAHILSKNEDLEGSWRDCHRGSAQTYLVLYPQQDPLTLRTDALDNESLQKDQMYPGRSLVPCQCFHQVLRTSGNESTDLRK